MRIYNRNNDEVLNFIALFFTKEEVNQLDLGFEKLLSEPDTYTLTLKGQGVEGDLTKELILKIYTDKNKSIFDNRIQKLINENK